jgi:hypothetical protein
MANITILNNVILPLLSVLPSSLDIHHALFALVAFHKIIIRAAFQLDKPSLKIRMNYSSSLRGRRTACK